MAGTFIEHDLPQVLTCYECDEPVEWLAPDSRCGECTRYTVAEVVGSIPTGDHWA